MEDELAMKYNFSALRLTTRSVFLKHLFAPKYPARYETLLLSELLT